METKQEWVLGCQLRRCSVPSGLGEDCGGHWDEGAGEENVVCAIIRPSLKAHAAPHTLYDIGEVHKPF